MRTNSRRVPIAGRTTHHMVGQSITRTRDPNKLRTMLLTRGANNIQLPAGTKFNDNPPFGSDDVPSQRPIRPHRRRWKLPVTRLVLLEQRLWQHASQQRHRKMAYANYCNDVNNNINETNGFNCEQSSQHHRNAAPRYGIRQPSQ
eukprot:11183719-Lingulodinium_polyedra.AAC.1